MNRLTIILGVFIALGFVGIARAQSTGTAPPPPPPGQVDSPPLEGPATDLKPFAEEHTGRQGNTTDKAEAPLVSHDAFQTSKPPAGDRVRAPKFPPAPIAERPSGRRPQPRAVWVPGYWDWDRERSEFVWMGGVWTVPPPGTIWVGKPLDARR